MICDVCGDNRFEIIERAKTALIESTNIETSEDEMKVIDNFLFRCWQMGWLDKYDYESHKQSQHCPCKDCKHKEHCHETVAHTKDHDGFREHWSETIEWCSRGERREP